MMSVTPRTIRSCQKSKSSSRIKKCIVERLEGRWLLTNTVQVVIPAQITTITAETLQNTGVSFKLHDMLGTLTATGENLAVQTAGSHVSISGMVSGFDDISFANTTASSTIAVTSKAVDIPLFSFESTGPIKMMDMRPFLFEGNVSLLAPAKVQLGDGKGATLNISQTVSLVNLTGGNFSDSQINFTAANPTAKAPALVLKFNNLMDTQLNVQPFIKTMNLHSVTESTAGASGITANSAGAIGTASDYKADLTFKPSFGLKYTLDNFYVGGTASGNWNVPGGTRLDYANISDSGYVAKFGSIGTYTVKQDFSGSLTAGSIGKGIIGHNMLNGTMMLTNSFAANSWNIGSLFVGNAIENSTINSDGNLGVIQTMFTYTSRIQAGLSPSYTFGQPITSSTYTSNSVIKSFTSDCPSHHNIHFVGGYVGAYDLQNVHLGNTQTQYFGIPFGLAGVRMDHVSLQLNSKAVNLNGLNSAASLDTGLQKYGLTEPGLGDFKLMFPM